MALEFCTCGRPMIPRHCIECGSTNIYGREASGAFTKLPNGTFQRVRGWRCRKCMIDFSELEDCKAMPAAPSKAAAKVQAREDLLAVMSAIRDDPDMPAAEKNRRMSELADQLQGRRK